MKKQKSHTKLFMGIFIAFLMIASILGIIVSNPANSEEKPVYEYEGYEFYRTDTGWAVKDNENYLPVDYLPEEVKNIAYEDINLNSDKIYLAYTPGNYDASEEYAIRKLGTFLSFEGRRLVLACNQEEGCGDIPIIDCNVDYAFSFIIGEDEKIYNKDNCVMLMSNDTVDFSKEVDVVIYKTLGVL